MNGNYNYKDNYNNNDNNIDNDNDDDNNHDNNKNIVRLFYDVISCNDVICSMNTLSLGKNPSMYFLCATPIRKCS